MKATKTEIDDVLEIDVDIFGDQRGSFSETFRDNWFREHVSDQSFVQENQSLSRAVGTVRGLHYQTAPWAQGKLVRCVVGAIFDVAVDIRFGSPTFGKWVARTLTASQGNQLWLPEGFLHGFCTLTSDAIVSYRVTNYYGKQSDAGVAWDDPDIDIAWPDIADPSRLSEKDKFQPKFSELPRNFIYRGEA